MRFGHRTLSLKWPITLGVLGILLAGGYIVNRIVRAEREAEAGGDVVQAPRRLKNGKVVLTADLVKDHGIRDEPAQPIEWSEPIAVYGRLVPNPRATTIVQAPLAGTLRTDAKEAWPTVGASVRAGQVLGQLDVRVGPQERLDLKLKLKEASLKVQGSEKVVAIQQERLSRLEKASRGEQIVSQRELDDARVSLTEAKTNLSSAQAAEELWKGAVDAIERPADSSVSAFRLSLTAPAGGEIVETAARPGMSVEAGAAIARVVDFRHALAEMDLPPEVLAAGPPKQIELAMLPASPQSTTPSLGRLTATLTGPAPEIDTTSQFTSYWYEATVNPQEKAGLPAAWRPGRFVTALVRLPEAPKLKAVTVPVTAVLAHEGRLLVYVRVAEAKYMRREVRLLGREGDRAVLAPGVQEGEPVVVQEAQVLLSEEFRAKEESEEPAKEDEKAAESD